LYDPVARQSVAPFTLSGARCAYLPTRQRILSKHGGSDEKALFLTKQGTRLTL
jgi:hypothetical protein